jgi:choline dehydrogenase
LSADSTKRVLLIEAGKKDNYHWIHIPVGYLYCIGNPRTDWLFQTAPDAGLNGRSLRYPRGKVMGGCSSINGMIYMRGQARDYDQWAAMTGDQAWSWRQCLPYFKLHEDYHLGHDDLHGAQGHLSEVAFNDHTAYGELLRAHAGGEWRIERQRLRWDILDAFAQAAEQAGIPASNDFNRGDNEGVGYFEVNQRRGWRWNTAKAFLRSHIRQRANLTVWTQSQVSQLMLQQRPSGGIVCTGVEVHTPSGVVQAWAQREVILSAGAIGSPHLLMLSGIGPADHLHSMGVRPQVTLPGVGANLQDHLQIRSVYKVQGVKTLNTQANSLWGKASIALEYLLKRSGPMSMAPSQLGAFTKSSPDQAHANLEYHVQPLSLDAFGEPLHQFPAFTASVCNLNPTSRGSIRLKSAAFDQAPIIAPNYLSTPQDQQVAADSLRVTRRIVAQPALARYQPEEFKPGVQFQTDEELTRLAGDIATTIFHPVGTARMGQSSDPMTVVDTRLRVRNGQHDWIGGLRVVDASVMPTITSGNTNSPTLMMAEKAAQWIAHDALASQG